jgi:inhibitor of cysteine peptidase
MKTIFYTLIILILLAGSLAACQVFGKTTTISESDAGKTITIKNGETLVVKLKGNITTGYTWVPAGQDPQLLTQVGENEYTPESNLIGAPGTIILKFTATATGQTVLRLEYKRPWETDVAPSQTFEVTVIVE